jgi:hypothetical protein
MEALYGLTIEQYDALFAEQGGMCAICTKPESARRIKGTRPLSVDHNHLTGQIRGLLCSNCNRALGLFGEDTDIMKRAIYYLRAGENAE